MRSITDKVASEQTLTQYESIRCQVGSGLTRLACKTPSVTLPLIAIPLADPRFKVRAGIGENTDYAINIQGIL